MNLLKIRTNLRPGWMLCLLILGGAGTSKAELIYGLTSTQELILFDSDHPSEVQEEVLLQGFGVEQLVAIDGRPATSELYGISVTQKIYKINTRSGEVVFVGQPSPEMPVLDFYVGFDFNPTVDRIRWVNGQALNQRFHPDTGSLVAHDGNLAYAVGDSYFGFDPEILGVAYLNDGTLFGVDTRRDTLIQISPPNNGVLQTLGTLGINAGVGIGFDASPFTGTLYGAFTDPLSDESVLYQIHPTHGKATPLGTIGDGKRILSIAVALDVLSGQGTQYEVTTLQDVVGDDGQLSLREALEAANQNAAYFEAPAGTPSDQGLDEIRFHSDLAGLTIELESGELVIRDSVRIQGYEPANLVIDALQKGRVLTIESSAREVYLEHLQVTGGFTDALGGGIWVKEEVKLNLGDVVIHGNQASQGGGIFSSASVVEGTGVQIHSNQAEALEVPNSNGFSSSGSGFVQVNGSLILEESEVNNDGVLRGNAVLSGNPVIQGALVALDQSVIAPGSSPGTLITGDAYLSDTTTYQMEILGSQAGVDIDLWKVSGKLTLMNPTLDGSILEGLDFDQGETLTLIDHTGSEPTRGMFAGQPEGSFMWIGLKTFQISYQGGDGNDVVLSPLGQLGRVNLALNEVPFINPETGRIEQRVTLFNNTSVTQAGIVLFVSDLPPGIVLENSDGEIELGNPAQATPLILLGHPLASGENRTLLFEYSGEVENILLSPSYSIRSRAVDGDEVVITLILKRLDGSVLLEFQSQAEKSYRVRSSRNLLSWEESETLVADSELTSWIDSETNPEGGLKFYQIIEQ